MQIIRKPKPYAPLFATARCFPVANRILIAFTIFFIVFNGSSLLLSLETPPLFERWLVVSQPLVDWASSWIPAMNFAHDYLTEHHRQYLVPAIENNLATNFLLLFLSVACSALCASVDVVKRWPRVDRNLRVVFSNVSISLNDYLAKGLLIYLGFLVLMFFGRGIRPYTINLQVNHTINFIQFCCFAVIGSVLAMLAIFKIVGGSDLEFERAFTRIPEEMCDETKNTLKRADASTRSNDDSQ